MGKRVEKSRNYATSPTYAERLIRIIEDFDLFRYDDMVIPQEHEERKSRHTKEKLAMREVLETNRVKFVRAAEGDSYATITAELGKLDWEILEYNDGSVGDSILKGQVVYIQPKRNRAQAGEKEHVFKTGETMRMVSQLYAIKLESLYRMNNLKRGTRAGTRNNPSVKKSIKDRCSQTAGIKGKSPGRSEEGRGDQN